MITYTVKDHSIYDLTSDIIKFLNNNNYPFFEDILRNTVYAIAVAYDNNKIVGTYVLKRLSSTISELAYSLVLPQYRQKGIAKELGNRLIKVCNTPFLVATTKINKPAMNMVKSHKGKLVSTNVNKDTNHKLCLFVHDLGKPNSWFSAWSRALKDMGI